MLRENNVMVMLLASVTLTGARFRVDKKFEEALEHVTLDSGSDLYASRLGPILAGPSGRALVARGATARAALVHEVDRQAGVRWGQVSSGLLWANRQQLRQCVGRSLWLN